MKNEIKHGECDASFPRWRQSWIGDSEHSLSSGPLEQNTKARAISLCLKAEKGRALLEARAGGDL